MGGLLAWPAVALSDIGEETSPTLAWSEQHAAVRGEQRRYPACAQAPLSHKPNIPDPALSLEGSQMALNNTESTAVNTVVRYLTDQQNTSGHLTSPEEAIQAFELLARGAYKTLTAGVTAEQTRALLESRWLGTPTNDSR